MQLAQTCDKSDRLFSPAADPATVCDIKSRVSWTGHHDPQQRSQNTDLAFSALRFEQMRIIEHARTISVGHGHPPMETSTFSCKEAQDTEMQ